MSRLNAKVAVVMLLVMIIIILVTLTVLQGHRCREITPTVIRSSNMERKTAAATPLIENGKTSAVTHKLTYRKHGHIGALNYVGQQGSGLQVLLSLQCMVSAFDLPMLIPEPILVDTKLSTFKSKRDHESDEESIKFGDVFDIDNFNEVSTALGYPLMERREQFAVFAPKDLIYVEVNGVSEREMSKRSVKVIWTSADALNNDSLTTRKAKQHLDTIDFPTDFNLVKIVEVSASIDDLHSYVLSESELLKDILGGVSPENVTVLFSKWKALWHIVNHHTLNPHKCLGVGYNSDKEQFRPSSRLLADVDRYEKMFLSSGYNVAVMFRIERLMQHIQSLKSNDPHWTVDKCLNEVVRITNQLQRYEQPMITLDLGKFASNSWQTYFSSMNRKDLTAKVNSRIASLFKSGWNLKDWEKSFVKATGGLENKGYIAALQRTLASRAECLVMIGGGSFQDLAMKDYIRNHPRKEDQCIHSVCMTNVEYVFSRVKNANA